MISCDNLAGRFDLTVKIVTDSGADISAETAKELGITIVPLYIYFGGKTYRDGIEMTPDELYKRLENDPVHPTTTQPMPYDFTGYYEKISEDADAIVSIHVSAKASGTYNAALQGARQSKGKCEVHVVDSSSVSVGQALITTAAARIAGAGGSLKEVLEETHRAVAQTQIRGLLDSLKYLLKGGRITKTKALIGSLLKVKPLLTMNNGEIAQTGVVRSYSKGVEKLLEFVKGYHNLQEAALSHSTVPEAANTLKKGIASIIDEKRIQMSRVGAALGVHGGPGTLLVALRGGSKY